MKQANDRELEASISEFMEQGQPVEPSLNRVTTLEDHLDDVQVVRLNQFGLEPTSVDKAAAQMQFFDSETNMHSVLYLRGDEDYGMIQPKSD